MLVDEAAAPAGVGYWSLRKEGYKEIELPDWPTLKDLIVAHILGVVDRIREGRFEVDSRKSTCETYCEFRSICRIRQVRLAGKQREHETNFQLPVQTRRRSSR